MTQLQLSMEAAGSESNIAAASILDCKLTGQSSAQATSKGHVKERRLNHLFTRPGPGFPASQPQYLTRGATSPDSADVNEEGRLNLMCAF